jgi:hypothetical protein
VEAWKDVAGGGSFLDFLGPKTRDLYQFTKFTCFLAYFDTVYGHLGVLRPSGAQDANSVGNNSNNNSNNNNIVIPDDTKHSLNDETAATATTTTTTTDHDTASSSSFESNPSVPATSGWGGGLVSASLSSMPRYDGDTLLFSFSFQLFFSAFLFSFSFLAFLFGSSFWLFLAQATLLSHIIAEVS